MSRGSAATLAASLRAMPRYRAAASLPGSETTVGWPASVCSRIASVSGRLPSQGVSYCSAMRRPPPSPKMCSAWPHCEQMWMAMFSTTPRMGTSTFWNMRRPLRASSSATSCGVVTMTAPTTGTFCASVSATSPVPGGMSTIR